MKHTYKIEGMTCNGCRASVEEKLKAVRGVSNVAVDLENHEATIEMEKHIALDVFKNALPTKYSISEKEEKNVFQAGKKEEKKSDWQQLFPLFLIFGYLFASAFLLNRTDWNWQDFMLDFMGLFYIVFSFFKFLDLKGFPESFRMYDPVAKVVPAYGWVYPFIEVVLGLMFLMRFQIPIALIITIIILGLTTIGVTRTLLSNKAIQCACLGTALKLPMTKATFIENSIMLVMAIIMLIKIYN